jgi:hypothetical protein
MSMSIISVMNININNINNENNENENNKAIIMAKIMKYQYGICGVSISASIISISWQ